MMIGVANSGSSLVDIGPLLSAIFQGLGVIVLGITAVWVRSHVKDQAAQQTVLTAVENAVSYAENHYGVKPGTAYTIPVAKGVGATALQYVVDQVPDAVKRMGLDYPSLAKLVVAKMPSIDRTPLDPSTVDDIVNAASGKTTAPTPSTDDLIKALEPLIQKMVAKYTEAGSGGSVININGNIRSGTPSGKKPVPPLINQAQPLATS